MSLYTRVQRPEYTDWAALVGPDVRWVEEDYRDLQQYAPEVLLGYRVVLTTVADFHQRTRGLWITKFVVSDEATSRLGWYRYNSDMHMSLERFEWARIEYWHIHRGEGIWRVE